MKVCNQYPVRDANRDKRYIATLKCNYCKEVSNLEESYPLKLDKMINFLVDFIKLHKRKGCNKIQLPIPLLYL